MRFAHFFIDRPVFATVLAIITVIVGGIALTTLPISQYPDIVPPTIIVRATYPGANAKTVSDVVATPIEQQVNGVERMLYMSSQATADGTMILTITFELGTNLDIAQVQVQNRVKIAEPQLPEDVRRLGVTVTKSSPDLTIVPCLISPDKSRDQLYIGNFAVLQIRDELARLSGVGDVRVFGARDYSMRVWIDPEKVAARNLTALDVVRAIQEQNIQVAAGVVGAPPTDQMVEYQLTVNSQGRLTDPAEFGDIVLKRGDDGQITTVKDVARVELGARDYAVTAYYNGQPAVALPVFQLPGSNAIDVADKVLAKMEELKAKPNWPKGVDFFIGYDATIFVRESIRDVVKTLFEAVLLVVIVVIVFLQTWRASIIPLLAIPVSLIGTFAFLKVFGFSLNNLTLFGLVLSIGIVVDDAIVVVENVQHWIERGLTPRAASYKAMGEVTTAVIAVAAGLSAIFVPTAFLTGITGQFYRQFALTISISTLISAFNSLTLSPAMAAILLKPGAQKGDWLERIIQFTLGWFFKLFNRGLGHFTNTYIWLVTKAVRLSVVVLLVYVGLLVLTYFGFRSVPTGFIPAQDGGYLIANAQLADSAGTERTNEVILRMGNMVKDMPGVKHTFGIAGFSVLNGTNQSNVGAMFIVLKPFDERRKPELGGFAIMGQIQNKFNAIQEAIALVFPPPAVRGIGAAGGFKMMVQDRSAQGLATLQTAVDNLSAAGRQDTQLQGVFSSFRSNTPQLFFDVDRVRAKSQGVTLGDLFSTLQIYLGSLYVNDFNLLGRTYQVVAQADSKFRLHADDIVQLKTRNSAGDMVPLGSLGTVREINGPDKVTRYNLFPAAEINGAAIKGISTSVATDKMEALFEKEARPLGMDFQWTELTLQEKLAGNAAVYIFPLCILFVFLVHSAEYESWSLPTAIILIVPMCLLCAIGGVIIHGMENNIFTQIGFVVLAGLACKNAVLIVEFAKQQEEDGKNVFDAVIEACRLRLRPILMTSFAFILGVVPLMTARGAGAEMRQSLGTAVFYGMLGVTFFGIFLTPVFYYSIRYFQNPHKYHKHDPAGGAAGDI